MALKRFLPLLMLAKSACAFVNYTVIDINGTLLNMTGEAELFRQGDWLMASWLFWVNVFPAEFYYLPIVVVTMLFGYVGYVKSRSVVVPAIWFLVMATVIGGTMWAGIAPFVGFIALGVVLAAIIIVFMKNFFG